MTDMHLKESIEREKIVFFDGVCGICNGFVDFLLRINKDPLLKFAPLQGSTAAERLTEQSTKDLNTIVFQMGTSFLYKSTAAIEIVSSSGGIWWLVRIFLFLPTFLRDWVYDLIANNRYRLAGKKEECRLPSPQERARFLP